MNEKGQAFTLESVVASLLLLVVAYFLFRSTLLIAPQSTQVTDVQLSQYAKDTLRLLDSPASSDDTLEYTLEHINSTYSAEPLLNAIKECLPKDIMFNLDVYYFNNTTGKVEVYKITHNIPTSNTVTVSRCVVINSNEFVNGSPFVTRSAESSIYPVVLEVRLTLWRV